MKKIHCFKVKKGERKIIFIKESGKYKIELLGERAEAEIVGVFIGKNNENFKIETFQLHKASKTKSRLLIKSILFDNSSLVHKGTIHITANAQESNAFQEGKVVLMSKNAFCQTKPELEILAHDVKCSHSSAVSEIDKKQLFYLISRGLNKKQAENLLLKGFLKEIFDKLDKKQAPSCIKIKK